MTIQAAQRLDPEPISGEELFARGDIGRSELLRGRVITMSPTGYRHGQIEARLTRALLDYAARSDTPQAEVMSGEVGIYTGREPDTVRGADVLWIRAERLATARSESYLDVAPELVVEILSPDDRWSAVTEKLAEYFAIGVELVWIVDSRQRRIFAYRALDEIATFAADAELTAGDTLPGFRARVSELLGA